MLPATGKTVAGGRARGSARHAIPVLFSCHPPPSYAARHPHTMSYGLRTTDHDANLDRHFRLFVPRLGGRFLSSGHPIWEDARLLLSALSSGRAEFHLLSAADGGDADSAGRADTRWLPIPRQAAAHAQP